MCATGKIRRSAHGNGTGAPAPAPKVKMTFDRQLQITLRRGLCRNVRVIKLHRYRSHLPQSSTNQSPQKKPSSTRLAAVDISETLKPPLEIPC
jgi:hypothetical protein